MFVDELFSHDEDEMTIRSINNNYDYINMQFHWRNKTRLKCIKKKKNFNKNLFIFVKKEDKILLRTATTRAFMSAVARYQKLKSPNQSFAVCPVFCFILSNLATMRTRSLLIL